MTDTLPLKPKYGDPCNGCGLCCMNKPCPLGQFVFDTVVGPCPALQRDGPKFVCGLMVNPARYAPARAARVGERKLADAAKLLNGAGTGCDARAEGEPTDEKFSRKLHRRAMESWPKAEQMKRRWGVPDGY